jgi:SAM-dependent methyltransferase
VRSKLFQQKDIEALSDLFGTNDIHLAEDAIFVRGKSYPIVDDVVVLLEEPRYPPSLRSRMNARSASSSGVVTQDEIQFSFGEEWSAYPDVLPEHTGEFAQYFDLIDLDSIKGKTVCDLGCGIGRWSFFLQDHAELLVLVDFSDAIFVARENLKEANALFFLGDITELPFRKDFADMTICLGVAHHLPTNGLDAIRRFSSYAPRHLVYLYSALDGRPGYFRLLLHIVNVVRLAFSKIRNRRARSMISFLGATLLYRPLICIGTALKPFGLANTVPLYDFYKGKSLKRLQQDVYDRFFTSIEQRFSRDQIRSLEDTFSRVSISPGIPMWHFLCEHEYPAAAKASKAKSDTDLAKEKQLSSQ